MSCLCYSNIPLRKHTVVAKDALFARLLGKLLPVVEERGLVAELEGHEVVEEQCVRGNSQGWERIAVGGTTRQRKRTLAKQFSSWKGRKDKV